MSEPNDTEYLMPIPPRSEDLIKQLVKNNPKPRILPADSIEHIYFEAGKQNLIEDLLERLNQTSIYETKGDIKI